MRLVNDGLRVAVMGLLIGIAGCAGGDEVGAVAAWEVSAGEHFCQALTESLDRCGPATPCDDALVKDCGDLADVFSTSYLSSAAYCIDGGSSAVSCLRKAVEDATPSDAHHAFAAKFCGACALGVPGCEDVFFTEGEGDVQLVGAVIRSLGDDLVKEITDKCTDGLTCLATFANCARDVLVERALPEATVSCMLNPPDPAPDAEACSSSSSSSSSGAEAASGGGNSGGCTSAADCPPGSECTAGGCKTSAPPVCGDGTLGVGEECDDGNATDGDGCDACKVVCLADEKQLGTSCYVDVTSHQTWESAKSACEASLGGHLVTLETMEEDDFVWGQVMGSGETNPRWIGLDDAAAEGVWVWTNGSAPDALNWEAGEPNDAQAGEDCAEFAYAKNAWNDVSCDDTRAFICEYEPPVLHP